jgi:hypothetical protein
MFPLNDSGVISGLVCGVLFGFVLENSGFGSPCKLTAQFQLRDWSVFKVMFTAIVVAAFGLYGLRLAGVLQADAVFVPTALLVAAGIGGAFVGAGFAVGGYCPGTSVVGLFSGRIDALVFLLGLLIGTAGFALIYGASIEEIMAAGEVQAGDTVGAALGVSDAAVLAVLLVFLALVFYVGGWFERRSSGPITADQAVAGAQLNK